MKWKAEIAIRTLIHVARCRVGTSERMGLCELVEEESDTQSQGHAIEDSLSLGTGTWMRLGEPCMVKCQAWLNLRTEA